ncbi:hypothetical protein CRUP_033295 [Coryphaenoides rupestris]|nr:hypothetical protein CRUP_033295 [Coryphaenoides rupestris]
MEPVPSRTVHHGTWSCRRVTPAPLLLCPPPASPSRPLSLPPCPPASVAHCRAARGPLPLDPQAEAGGHGDMVTLGRPKPAAMSSGAATPPERARGSSLTPDRYKPFSSQAHYQQVMLALRKLRESGFYWGRALLRSQAPGTFLVRDSSDHRHFFTLSVQTVRGTKNLRIHSERGGFFLQPDPHSARQPPQFDCVLKLIAHYMGKGCSSGPVPRYSEAITTRRFANWLGEDSMWMCVPGTLKAGACSPSHWKCARRSSAP